MAIETLFYGEGSHIEDMLHETIKHLENKQLQIWENRLFLLSGSYLLIEALLPCK